MCRTGLTVINLVFEGKYMNIRSHGMQVGSSCRFLIGIGKYHCFKLLCSSCIGFLV